MYELGKHGRLHYIDTIDEVDVMSSIRFAYVSLSIAFFLLPGKISYHIACSASFSLSRSLAVLPQIKEELVRSNFETVRLQLCCAFESFENKQTLYMPYWIPCFMYIDFLLLLSIFSWITISNREKEN